MADVDLIPADYLKLRLVRRRLRQLLIACAAVAVAVGGARLALTPALAFERASIARLQQEGQRSTRSQAEADRYREQKLLVEKQLAELAELRGRDRLRLLLQAIDAAYSDSVWLDELRFVRLPAGTSPGGPRQATILGPGQNAAAPGATPQPAPGATPQPAPTEQRVELTGHALNHTRLAEFMRSLGSQPGIAEVRLLNTAMGSYRDNPVIDVTLTLLVDDKAGRPR